jgi:hypothetical protein
MKLRLLLAFVMTALIFTTITTSSNAQSNPECDYSCQLTSTCKGDNAKLFKNINTSSCLKFREYYSELVSASRKYSTPTLKLTPYVLSGLIDRETLWTKALKPATCEGYGDGDYGHGLVQIHGRFSTPRLDTFGKPNTPVLKSTKKYGNEYFNWSSCNESINYLGAYLMNVEDAYGKSLVTKLANSSMNVMVDGNGSFVDYKTQYAYTQMLINSYNAGGYGVIMKDSCVVNPLGQVLDNCTTGKDYSTDIITRAQDFYRSDVGMEPWQGELFRFDW